MCSLLCRAFSKVIKDENGCWNYKGCKDKGGYAKIQKSKYVNAKASRAIYEEIHQVKLGRFDFVCHKCDNPACINPDHFFIGTPQDNIDDCFKKNRFPVRLGEDCRASKLTWEKVDEIRKLRNQGWILKRLGNKFNTTYTNIWNICSNKTWRAQ